MPQLQSRRNGDASTWMCCERTLLLWTSNMLPHGKDEIFNSNPTSEKDMVCSAIKPQTGYPVTSGQLIWRGQVCSAIWSNSIIPLQIPAVTSPQAQVLPHAAARRKHPLVLKNNPNTSSSPYTPWNTPDVTQHHRPSKNNLLVFLAQVRILDVTRGLEVLAKIQGMLFSTFKIHIII